MDLSSTDLGSLDHGPFNFHPAPTGVVPSPASVLFNVHTECIQIPLKANGRKWVLAHEVFKSIPLKLCWLFADKFYLPFPKCYMKQTLKMSDDLSRSLNWMSPDAAQWLPVCSCFLDLSYMAIFASSSLVHTQKYVWVGKVVQ